MKAVYRTSLSRIVSIVLIGVVIAFGVAIANPRPTGLFVGIAGAFLLIGVTAWGYTAVRFEGDNIVRIVFFFFRSRRALSSVRKVRFDTNVDSFGGRTSYMTIEFRNGGPFLLFDFTKSDLREIAERISSVAPDAIDPTLTAHLNEREALRDLRDVFRSINPVIFGGGTIFIIIAVLWWLLSRK